MFPASRILVSLVLALPALASATEPGAPVRVVVLPFENLAAETAVFRSVMPLVEKGLAARGYEVVGGAQVEDYLEKQRIRYLDSLEPYQIQGMLTELDADRVLVGAVLFVARQANPSVALIARMVDGERRVQWADFASVGSHDTKGLLGLGVLRKLDDIVPLAVDKLLQSMPEAGEASRREATRSRASFKKPRAYRTTRKLGDKPVLALMPLENATEVPGASRVVEALLLRRVEGLPALGVVETADLRRAFRRERVWPSKWTGSDQIERLSQRVGTTYFVRGAIQRIDEVAGSTGVTVPDVEIYLSVIDSETGRVVWSSTHQRRGDDYEGFFLSGVIRTWPELADQVLAEMLKTLTD